MGALLPDGFEHLLAGVVESVGGIALGGRESLDKELLRRECHALHAELGAEAKLRAVLGGAVPGAGTSRGR